MFKSYIINAKEPNKGAINFSELLDAPAGKHGFLGTTEDGHLAFEDGKRFRIIGTSMVKSGCLPEHDVAECVAERLSSNGINMVRMHYADGICDVGNYDGNEFPQMTIACPCSIRIVSVGLRSLRGGRRKGRCRWHRSCREH